MIRDEIHQYPDTALMRRLYQGTKIFLTSIRGIKPKVIFHSVAVIISRMLVDRTQPDGIDPQVSQIVQACANRLKCRATKQEGNHAVDNCVLCPGRIFPVIIGDARLAIFYDKIDRADILLPSLVYYP